jgi:RNA polymerase sigma-70 factor, ECF subfamily
MAPAFFLTDSRSGADSTKMEADTLPGTFASPADSGRGEQATGTVPSTADVYAQHFKYVWRCLRSLGVTDQALDDAVQDVFMVVQRKLAAFDHKAQLRTWLYAIALRVARRYRTKAAKAAQKLVDEDSAVEEHSDAAVPSEALEHGERLELAQRALKALDDDKREAFVLACIEQMSAPEIAGITGLPLNTVYSRVRAARLAFNTQVSRLTAASRRSGP